MELLSKICLLYPELKLEDFMPPLAKIILQNDGKEDYIKEWNHPTLLKPTQKQLDTITG